MKLLRILALLVFPALAAIGARSADSAPVPPSTASCEQIALHLRSGSEDGYRIVLGRVGIPDEEHTSGRASRNRDAAWPYFAGSGSSFTAAPPR